MQTFTVGFEENYGSQAIFVADQMGPGVVIAQWGDGGIPAHIAFESGYGVLNVFFENGPPPGSPQMMQMMGLGPYARQQHDPTPENLLIVLDG